MCRLSAGSRHAIGGKDGRPHVAFGSKVLADRMGCLKGGVVANVVVPTPDYLRFNGTRLTHE